VAIPVLVELQDDLLKGQHRGGNSLSPEFYRLSEDLVGTTADKILN